MVAGRSYAELTERFNRRFGLEFTVERLKSTVYRLGLGNGRDCRFHPGQISHNKGKKGYCAPGSEKGWFKPGHRPHTWKPVGTERIDREGYVEVRIRNSGGKLRKNWKAKQRIIWEKAYGKIPRGSVVLFADGNKQNFALENLLLVSRGELAVMNRNGLIFSHGDLTKAGKTIADIKLRIADLRRGSKKRKPSRAAVKRGAP
jgi:hypothetical protein